MNVLVVGLSGVTNGGKTTLCNRLLKILPLGTKAINQDEYFLPEDSPLHVPCSNGINHHNWELLSSLDMNKMVCDINHLLSEMNSSSSTVESTKSNAISLCSICKNDVEIGPASLNIIKRELPKLSQCPNHKKVLLVDGFTIFDDERLKELCNIKFFLTLSKDECFSRRITRSYDPPDPPGYFEKCVWPMYEAHLTRVKNLHDINFLDGKSSMDETVATVLTKILKESIKKF